MKKDIIIVALIIFLAQSVAAAHYIVGYVNNASDGTSPNGKTIFMWNYFTLENMSSTIGPSGPSGEDNKYIIDCELLSTPCDIGDTLTLEVINDSDNYVGLSAVNVTVTAAANDTADNITLNSPPNATNQFPTEGANISGTVSINCSSTDPDSNLQTSHLYLNSSGWHLNESLSISGSSDYAIFSKDFPDGEYKYSCVAEDERGVKSTENYNTTFNVDSTNPIISSMEYNETELCEINRVVSVNCTTTDAFTGIQQVLIGNGDINYSALYLSGDTYFADIGVYEFGNIVFECYAEDYAGNIEKMDGAVFSVSEECVDVYASAINIPNTLIENIVAEINATIENVGTGYASVVMIGLFAGDPDTGGFSIANVTTSIAELSSKNVSFNWTPAVGITNLFVKADVNDSFSEGSELDNTINGSAFLSSWQEFYGNISADRIIGTENDTIELWGMEAAIEGNIFIIDKESQVDWVNLQAIGRKNTSEPSSSDFFEIDTILNMTTLNDSVSEIFSTSTLDNFEIHGATVFNVPIVNSTSNSNFKTGILWDMSDDTNGEFDSTEKEDIIFVSKINKSTVGKYGTYDHEIKIPARLRSFDNTDVTEVYLYYDLN